MQGSFDEVKLGTIPDKPGKPGNGMYLGGASYMFDSDGSTLTLYGVTNMGGPTTLAITGGTGKYGYGVAGQADYEAFVYESGPYKGRQAVNVTICITTLGCST